MPRNPRPDQIGMGGRMLSVQVAGSPRNTHMVSLISMKLREHFVRNVIKYRKNAGLSQENLAKAAGVSRAHMGRIENTRHAVNIDTLEKIAVALNIDAAALLQPPTN